MNTSPIVCINFSVHFAYQLSRGDLTHFPSVDSLFKGLVASRSSARVFRAGQGKLRGIIKKDLPCTEFVTQFSYN